MSVTAQTTMTGEIIVDAFAGGGGASTGIETALGRTVDIAINHDPAAILLHKTNHPYTEHYQESIWAVDPSAVCRGRPVALMWASPDCKHFSKAKGSALVSRNIRGLAWVVLRWAGKVRPRVIIIENVEEFQTWGPVRKGKPVKKKAGQTFQKFLWQLGSLGYAVEHRELVAADYGAPTTRKRFVLIARCDGKPITWPEKTHAQRDSEAVKTGKLPAWRCAAEIIDWTLPCPSIFDGKPQIMEKYGLTAVRPLAENTLRRVIRGVDKFTIKSGKPFIVQCNHAGGDRAQSVGEPMPVISSHHGFGAVEPVIAPITMSNTGGSVGGDASQPVHTVRTAGGQLLVAPNLIQYHTERTENCRAYGLTKPLDTVDASNRYGLISTNLVEYYGNGNPLDIEEPMHTATSHDREAVTVAHIVKFKGEDLGSPMQEPVQTVTAKSNPFAECQARVAIYEQGADLGRWPEIRDLLNRYCGYTLKENELLLIHIDGAEYFLSDIGLRMLTPRELYNAMGFPEDYIIERDYTGKPYPKSQQVARCGNAVCPPMARAVVAAQFPEWSMYVDIRTMAELMQTVAV